VLSKRFTGGDAIDKIEGASLRTRLILSVGLALAIIVTFMWWGFGRGVGLSGDIAGVPLQHAEGEVTGVTFLPAQKIDPVPGALVSVTWDGKTGQFRTQTPPNPGRKVRISFRVGKSGKLYVQGLDPK